MSLQVWLPLNKDPNVIPDISSFRKESHVALTEDSGGWYKVSDSYHTSSRWGIYYDFEVKPNTTYTLMVYSKSTTGVSTSIGINSFGITPTWPTVRDTNATSTEKLTTYTWTTGENHTIARIYLAVNASTTIDNNYVFFKEPVVWETPRNQGLSDVTVTNNGAMFNSAGKLGGCYEFTSNGNNLSIPANAMNNFVAADGCSLAFWIKINNWYSSYATFFQAGMGSMSWSHYIFGILRNASNSTVCFTISDGSSASNANYLTSAWTTGEWMHVAFTYETGKCKIYLNGSLDKEYTTSIVPNFSKITKITIGRCNNDSSYQTNCDMNDIRIYNHCLSPMEVKELSKGLVLHYPLNRQSFGQENLITQSMIAADPWKSAISGNYTMDGKTGWILSNSQLYSKSGNGANNIFSGLTYDANTQYTISFKWRDDYRTDGKSSSLYIRFKYSDGTYSQVISSKDYNYWKEEILTSTSGKTVTAITTTYGNGGNLLFTDLKLEKGTIKTPTSPIVNSDLYNSMGLNGTIEYDTSDYCNNGIKTGVFNWTSDTPKYNVSTKFSGSNYILTDDGTFSWFDFNELTLAGWMKPTNSPSDYSGSFGIAHNSIDGYYSKCFSISNSTSKFTINAAKGSTWVWITSSYVVPINEWHHYVATLKGTDVKMYVDGELIHSATIDWGTAKVASDTKFQVGVDLPGSDETYQGYYSDIRAYTTALSADDIKSLYESNKL